MVNVCSVYNCKNNSIKNPKLSFFVIPTDNHRQKIWLQKIGRPEWIHENPESLHKRRVCGEHFSREMISGSRLKKNCTPCLFKAGIGEKGANLNASTSASSPSMDIENKKTEDIPCEDDIKPIVVSTPEKKSGVTQTSPRLSSSTPRKRKSQSVMKILKKKIISTTEKESKDISDEDFIQFCGNTFNSDMAEFMISELKTRRRNPHGYREVRNMPADKMHVSELPIKKCKKCNNTPNSGLQCVNCGTQMHPGCLKSYSDIAKLDGNFIKCCKQERIHNLEGDHDEDLNNPVEIVDLTRENDRLLNENLLLKKLISEMEDKNDLLLFKINVLEKDNNKNVSVFSTRLSTKSNTSDNTRNKSNRENVSSNETKNDAVDIPTSAHILQTKRRNVNNVEKSADFQNKSKAVLNSPGK